MFFQKALRADNDWWRYVILSLVLYMAVNLSFIFIVTIISYLAYQNGLDTESSEFSDMLYAFDFQSMGIDPDLGLLFMLFPFFIGFFILALLLPVLHFRFIKSLVRSFDRINWKKIAFSATIWFGLTLIFESMIYLYNPNNYIWTFDLNSFILLLLISIFILPFQTSLEELFFRGYLMQGIGVLSRNRWLPLIITSVIFGLMHSSNPEVAKFGAGYMMTYYIGMGFFLGIITLLDDGLELALGVHYANNFFGATMITFSGSALQTTTILRQKVLNIEFLLIIWLIVTVIALFIFIKKYKLNDLTKLYKTVEKIDIYTEEPS